jgi:hypothetical protein
MYTYMHACMHTDKEGYTYTYIHTRTYIPGTLKCAARAHRTQMDTHIHTYTLIHTYQEPKNGQRGHTGLRGMHIYIHKLIHTYMYTGTPK